jgi:dephospho-CoA kinase
MAKTLAITGGVAEGKSTVLAAVAAAGIPTCSADAVVAGLWSDPEIERDALAAIGLDPPFDRERVRARLEESAEARRALNRALHAPTLAAMRATGAVAFEVPLLVETCLQGAFDLVWVATCGPEEQRRRLVARLGDEQAATRMMAWQLPTRAKIPFADRVIRTNRAPGLVHEAILAGLAEDGFKLA